MILDESVLDEMLLSQKKKHIQMRLNKVLIIQGMQEEDWKMSTMWSFMGEFKA